MEIKTLNGKKLWVTFRHFLPPKNKKLNIWRSITPTRGTKCTIEFNNKKFIGRTELSSEDNLCKETGRKLALRRALNQIWPKCKKERTNIWKQYHNRGKSHSKFDEDMIVRTSDLGHTMNYYEVDTNATPDQLREVNFHSGIISTYRSQSTSIKQLKEACEKMGYIFEYKIIAENLSCKEGMTDEVGGLKVDYEAHYGNY